jgi:DNA-binding NtrC family response regulator
MVEEALHATEGSRVEAARMLGISRTTLLKKMNAEP